MSQGKASTSCWAAHWAVGWSVTLKCTTFRRACAKITSTKSTLKPPVGTVKKSRATSSVRWFLKKARQAGDGGRRGWTRYFSTVDFATAIPSFRISPRIRGDPHRRLAAEMSRISSRSALGIAGRPGSFRLRRAQCSRKRVRCQASTVAGCTKTRTSRQRDQLRDRHAQTRRSGGRTRGRRIDRR